MSDDTDPAKLAQRLSALAQEPGILRKAAERELSKLSDEARQLLVDRLIVLGRTGDAKARSVLPAMLFALTARGASPGSGIEAAPSSDHRAEAFKVLHTSAAEKRDAQLFSDSLGHLNQRARTTREVDELARLSRFSAPSVVRGLLQNPRVTEEMVIRMAARQPSVPEPLLEIWKSSRWSTRKAVQKALVFNPYLPLEVGTKILPLLSVPDLRELVREGGVHELLRQQAKQLIEGASPIVR